MLVGRSARGGTSRPLISTLGLGSRRFLRASGRRRLGPVGFAGDLFLEERYARASGEEAGTVFVEVCISPANL